MVEVASQEQAHCDHLNEIIAALRANPLASCFKIFGSAATGKAIPGDIDCIAEGPWPVKGEEWRTAMREYIALAESYYGAFDPFFINKKRVRDQLVEVLYCRTDDGRGWMVSKKARELIQAGRAGIPLLKFDKKFGVSLTEDHDAAPALPSFIDHLSKSCDIHEHTHLTEMFDKPVDFDWICRTQKTWAAEFEIDEVRYYVYMDFLGTGWHLMFYASRNDKFTLDDTGWAGLGARKVFATVLEIVRQFLHTIEPDLMTFTADKTAKRTQKGVPFSRSDFYLKLLVSLKPELDRLGYSWADDGTRFSITRAPKTSMRDFVDAVHDRTF